MRQSHIKSFKTARTTSKAISHEIFAELENELNFLLRFNISEILS